MQTVFYQSNAAPVAATRFVPFENKRFVPFITKTNKMVVDKVPKAVETEDGVIQFSSLGRAVYVISDLHIASGLNSNGNYEGTENFYADDSFVRFLNHLQQSVQNRSAMLIINGDFIDFLRICEYPGKEEDIITWQSILEHCGIKKTTDELRASIVDKEKKYGLKTNDYKSVWKLFVCSNGHRQLFIRLAQWIKDGNDVIIVKGNHDLEWHWPAVQTYFCYRMAQLAAGEEEKIETVFLQSISAHIHFVQHALTIDDKIYIEHGHLYERTTAVDGKAVMDNSEELSLPFGSFFNRYLINRLEFAYPYLDNVRPAQNILPILLRERFPLGVKILFQYIPFTLLIIPKKMYWYTFKYLLNFILIIILPLAITAFAIYKDVRPLKASSQSSAVVQQVLTVVKNFGFLFLSYIFGRILSMVGLKSPPTLSVYAKDIMKKNPKVEAVLFGHTHDPEQKEIFLEGEGQNKTPDKRDAKWYFNTGTWIPIFETSSANVRHDRTYTFIAIDCTQMPPCRERLQRWNDDAERIDPMNLNDRR